MMWGYGMDMGWWMWLWGPLLLIGIVVLVLLAVRLFPGGGSHGGAYGPPGPYGGKSRARQILDERFARGELTVDQYREQSRVLGEDH
ncbi:SHOCT domain-containing protein [Arthrobacter sp. CG_A4]|uniref:SHOCT domain-containing protein n=1 Tax=Arthrobacter sp. CG_A4 TaxID=3071706 RepID=UPI002DFD2002|nr:putative membrane protein [Arthrobacter sp. CG_A4]